MHTLDTIGLRSLEKCYPKIISRLQKTLKAYQEDLGIKSMEDTRDYNEDLHPSFLRALSCRKLDEIIDQNKKVIELLEKISKQ